MKIQQDAFFKKHFFMVMQRFIRSKPYFYILFYLFSCFWHQSSNGSYHSEPVIIISFHSELINVKMNGNEILSTSHTLSTVKTTLI